MRNGAPVSGSSEGLQLGGGQGVGGWGWSRGGLAPFSHRKAPDAHGDHTASGRGRSLGEQAGSRVGEVGLAPGRTGVSHLRKCQPAGHCRVKAPLRPASQLLGLLWEKQESVLLSREGWGVWAHPCSGRPGLMSLGLATWTLGRWAGLDLLPCPRDMHFRAWLVMSHLHCPPRSGKGSVSGGVERTSRRK